MAAERKRVAGELVGVLAAWQVAAAGGGWTDPGQLNPYAGPEPGPPPKTEAQKHREHRAGWAALERMVFGKVVHERE
jgi:hypothetical protein